jgi:hypothetical protein
MAPLWATWSWEECEPHGRHVSVLLGTWVAIGRATQQTGARALLPQVQEAGSWRQWHGGSGIQEPTRAAAARPWEP